jgi:hypothetical protein
VCGGATTLMVVVNAVFSTPMVLGEQFKVVAAAVGGTRNLYRWHGLGSMVGLVFPLSFAHVHMRSWVCTAPRTLTCAWGCGGPPPPAP